MRRRVEAVVFSACILLFIAATVWASTAGATQWHRTGASVFGVPCDASEFTGYRGASFAQNPWTFAELGMGTAMGGLPNHARIRVQDPRSHRQITLVKNDIGLGGGAIGGYRRTLDVLWPALHRLLRGRANCSWTGVLKWRRLR